MTELTTAFAATSVDPPRLEWTSRPANQFRLPRDTLGRKAGFGTISESQSTIGLRDSTLTRKVYWIPFWLIALPGVLYAFGLLLTLTKRRRRRRKGLCPGCGYDLRFSAERCPECGEVIPPSRRASTPTPPSSTPAPPAG